MSLPRTTGPEPSPYGPRYRVVVGEVAGVELAIHLYRHPDEPAQHGRDPGRAYEYTPDGDRLRFDPEIYAWQVEQELTRAREREQETRDRSRRLP